jgi:hypothetical protein
LKGEEKWVNWGIHQELYPLDLTLCVDHPEQWLEWISAHANAASGAGHGPRVNSDGLGGGFFLCWVKRMVRYQSLIPCECGSELQGGASGRSEPCR